MTEKGLFSGGLLRCRSRAARIACGERFFIVKCSVSSSCQQIKLLQALVKLLRSHFLNGWVKFLLLLKPSWKKIRCFIVILVLNSFRKQGIEFWFFAERLNNLLLNTVTPNFVDIFVFFGTASSFIERISFSEIETKREAILFLFGCSEVNWTWIITSKLANQHALKALFTCVVYTNQGYIIDAVCGEARLKQICIYIKR